MDMRTILIDGFDGYVVEGENFLSKGDQNVDLLIMKNENGSKNAAVSDLQYEANYITSSTRLKAFYQVKNRIDSEMSSDVTLYCSQGMGDFWFTVLTELLTQVYTWKIVQPYVNHQPTYDMKYITELNTFLSTYETIDDVVILKSDIIDSKFYHGFSTRKGGLSTAPGVSSLNMTPASIKRDSSLIGKKNINRLAKKAGFDPETFVRARAVHGNTVYVVGKEEPSDGYDCVISNQRNITVAAPGADCVMMVFADPITPAFGTCHSGWKGTIARACIETIKKMHDEFGTKAENVQVVLGPCLGPCCLEFGEKESELFKAINNKCVIRKERHEKPFIDLRLANRILLESIGVLPSNIDDTSVTLCTACNKDMFFSYRRDKIPFGNQVGFIGIR